MKPNVSMYPNLHSTSSRTTINSLPEGSAVITAGCSSSNAASTIPGNPLTFIKTSVPGQFLPGHAVQQIGKSPVLSHQSHTQCAVADCLCFLICLVGIYQRCCQFIHIRIPICNEIVVRDKNTGICTCFLFNIIIRDHTQGIVFKTGIIYRRDNSDPQKPFLSE